jgi:uncharacterized protein DUF6502
MPTASTTQVTAATRQLLRPVIHVLIRCGITWREFAELAKTTFVEVATTKFGKRGRPTNVSRTAMLTGIPRRDVRKQREKLAKEPDAPSGYVTRASLVLSAWHLEPEFIDAEGRPTPLPAEGEEKSFEALVRRCGGGDVPYSTLLKELRVAGAVKKRPDGLLEPLLRNYIPHAMDEQLIRLWGSVLADIATTYVHNLTRTGKTPTRFERAAVNDRIAAAALPEFRKYLESEGQAFLERADAWLNAHQAPDDETEVIRLGVGTYHIQD